MRGLRPKTSEMEARRYIYTGLRVVSELPLPEWASFEQAMPAGDPDVVISLDEVPDRDAEPTVYERTVTPDECRFFVPGTGHFRVSGGREIVIAPARGAAAHQLRPWLIGSAWASLCYQRGLFLIHASAVLVDGEAVLFCARAKGGKSTLAAQLNTRGYGLVSDDLCRLDLPADGPPLVYASMPRLKLWSDTLAQLGWSTRHLEPDSSRAGKFHVSLEAANLVEPSPVRAIYLLEWGELAIRRLSGMTALGRFLAAATYRGKLLESAGQLSRHSNRSMTMLQRVPVWELRRPRDLAAFAQAADLLANHWSRHRTIDE